MTSVSAESLAALRLRTSSKWRDFPADVLPLFVAEMDFPLAEPISEALISAVRRSDTGYIPRKTDLPEAFSGFASRRWNWAVDPADVRTTTDVSVAIVEVLRRVIRPGGSVVINPPVYSPFFDLVPEAGGTVVEVPLVAAEAGWTLDLDGLEAAFAAGAAAFLLCNPHNPLGHPHPAEELAAVASLASRYGVTVVSDEIHGPLALPGASFTPFLSVSDEARDIGVAVTSASKAWNLAGLKCALMVTGSERLRSLVDGMPEEVTFRTSQFGLIANTVAYTSGEPWLDAVIRTLDANRRTLGELLAAKLPSVAWKQPEASYLAWLDLRPLGWGDDPAAVILERAKVAINSGPSFGAQGSGFARLNFGCSPEMLEAAIDRIAAIV